MKDIKVYGTFATLTFTVDKKITDTYSAKIWLKYDVDDIFNSNYESVPIKVNDGCVTVTGTHTAQNYTVTFNTNNGASSTSTKTNVSAEKKVKLPTPTKGGYTCVGWSEDKNAVLPTYKCETEMNPGADMNLYAVWAKNNTKVTGVSVENVSLRYKDTVTLKPTVQKKEGTKYAVRWTTSDSSIANINGDGIVTATKRGKGTATITCTVTDQFGNVVKDTCKVSVSLSGWQWVKTYIFFGWIWY